MTAHSDVVAFALVGLAMTAGALAQRISGMGFALVVAPVVVLLIGPFDGVLLVNLAGGVSSGLVTLRVWRQIDWRQYALLTAPALLALLPGAAVSVVLGGPALQIVVGMLLLLALTASLFVARARRPVARMPAGILSGATSGFMSATAGVGGPGAALYAVLTDWDQRSFAATVQPFFMTLGLTSFLTKLIASPDRAPDYAWWQWLTVIVCTVAGLALGERLARHVSARAARSAVIGFSYAGAAAAIAGGVAGLL